NRRDSGIPAVVKFMAVTPPRHHRDFIAPNHPVGRFPGCNLAQAENRSGNSRSPGGLLVGALQEIPIRGALRRPPTTSLFPPARPAGWHGVDGRGRVLGSSNRPGAPERIALS